MKTEQEFHDLLTEYFVGMQDKDDPNPTLDADGKFAFVVIAFNKPTDPEKFVKNGADYPLQTGDKEAAVGCAVAQSCPEVAIEDDGKVSAESVMRAGVHALCATIGTKFLTEVALTQIVDQSQMVMRKRAGYN